MTDINDSPVAREIERLRQRVAELEHELQLNSAMQQEAENAKLRQQNIQLRDALGVMFADYQNRLNYEFTGKRYGFRGLRKRLTADWLYMTARKALREGGKQVGL